MLFLLEDFLSKLSGEICKTSSDKRVDGQLRPGMSLQQASTVVEAFASPPHPLRRPSPFDVKFNIKASRTRLVYYSRFPSKRSIEKHHKPTNKLPCASGTLLKVSDSSKISLIGAGVNGKSINDENDGITPSDPSNNSNNFKQHHTSHFFDGLKNGSRLLRKTLNFFPTWISMDPAAAAQQELTDQGLFVDGQEIPLPDIRSTNHPPAAILKMVDHISVKDLKRSVVRPSQDSLNVRGAEGEMPTQKRTVSPTSEDRTYLTEAQLRQHQKRHLDETDIMKKSEQMARFLDEAARFQEFFANRKLFAPEPPPAPRRPSPPKRHSKTNTHLYKHLCALTETDVEDDWVFISMQPIENSFMAVENLHIEPYIDAQSDEYDKRLVNHAFRTRSFEAPLPPPPVKNRKSDVCKSWHKRLKCDKNCIKGLI